MSSFSAQHFFDLEALSYQFFVPKKGFFLSYFSTIQYIAYSKNETGTRLKGIKHEITAIKTWNSWNEQNHWPTRKPGRRNKIVHYFG